MKVEAIVSFYKELFFEGAVQLRWLTERPEQAKQAAEAFVFHGPRYHGAGDAESEGIEGNYRLKDSASFVRDLLKSLNDGLNGLQVNPYWLVVAGYGSGKSHLALTSATLLSHPESNTSQTIVAHISQVDTDIGKAVQSDLTRLGKPVLVLTLDGMAGFHLGNALSRAVLTQLSAYGVDTGAIRALSPRFQSAEQFVERNFAFRVDSFAKRLHNLNVEQICSLLRDNDENTYSEVDAIYFEANGAPIPIEGQESAQELINTLCDVYCGTDGAFSSVVILFDEFGRYLEYAAEKPLLAGDAALQQIFQGVQDNGAKIRFIGFIQYELKAYLKRFGSADLRQLQRYITRFDSAQKWYLSTNMETIFAHMIRKEPVALSDIWREAHAGKLYQESWQRISHALPEYKRFPVWSDPERFHRVIAQGCWPLHPLATWFLTRQRDVVQSRSALTFIKEMIERVATEEAIQGGRLRQISAAELILSSMLPEMIAAEQQTGSTVAETLQLLLEKFSAHLDEKQRLVLAGVAILEKMRIGKHSQESMNGLLCEATALDLDALTRAQQALSIELGAIEWNRDLGQYELIADASTRGQFQQWLRKLQLKLTVDAICDLFVRRGAIDAELGDIATDFANQHNISTLEEWRFQAQFAHSHILEKAIVRAFQEWDQAIAPTDAKGKILYVYVHGDENITQVDNLIERAFSTELTRLGIKQAPIWVIGIADESGALAEHIGRLHLFDEQITAEERERFRRFLPEETERSKEALREQTQEAIRKRLFWVAGFDSVSTGRLKLVGNDIFNKVYPKTLPFPFDGFATSAAGGAADSAQLTRSLIARQVDGMWVQSLPKRLQNRAISLLVHGWKALSSNGTLTKPQEAHVKSVFEALEQSHQDDPKRTLWMSFKQLIAPPYGMNAASAGLLLGLVLAGVSPPRRLERKGDIIAAADWLNEAFSAQRGKHFLEKLLLEQSTLRFLSEDAAGRWRNLLHRWEEAQNYQEILDIAHEVVQNKKIDPLPETLEGLYLHLKERAKEIASAVQETEAKLKEYETRIEKAERNCSVNEFLNMAGKLIKKRKTMEEEGCWPDGFIAFCDQMLAIIQQSLPSFLSEWIAQQSCHSATQVNDFRFKMESSVETLQVLGFKAQAKMLEQQAHHSIAQVEARQKFSLTLAESEDYPRQVKPTVSTPVRDLRDAITKGDDLIKGVQSAQSVLSPEEINARIKAIEHHQQQLREMVKHQRAQLDQLFSLPLDNERALRDALISMNRLREIFVGTPDQNDVSDMITVLEHLLSDLKTWEHGETSPERLHELLSQQMEKQLETLQTFLDDKEIEPAWNLGAIYKAIAANRIDVVNKRSASWLAARADLVNKLETLDLSRCIALEKELLAAPGYLSTHDKEQMVQYLELVAHYSAKLIENLRQSKVKQWQEQFISLNTTENLTRYEVEQLLKVLSNPPVELTNEEKTLLQPIEYQLIHHLDKISIDDILARIERLPVDIQKQIFSILSKRLS